MNYQPQHSHASGQGFKLKIGVQLSQPQVKLTQTELHPNAQKILQNQKNSLLKYKNEKLLSYDFIIVIDLLNNYIGI